MGVLGYDHSAGPVLGTVKPPAPAAAGVPSLASQGR
jgi:hypothetical protein